MYIDVYCFCVVQMEELFASAVRLGEIVRHRGFSHCSHSRFLSSAEFVLCFTFLGASPPYSLSVSKEGGLSVPQKKKKKEKKNARDVGLFLSTLRTKKHVRDYSHNTLLHT